MIVTKKEKSKKKPKRAVGASVQSRTLMRLENDEIRYHDDSGA